MFSPFSKKVWRGEAITTTSCFMTSHDRLAVIGLRTIKQRSEIAHEEPKTATREKSTADNEAERSLPDSAAYVESAVQSFQEFMCTVKRASQENASKFPRLGKLSVLFFNQDSPHPQVQVASGKLQAIIIIRRREHKKRNIRKEKS